MPRRWFQIHLSTAIVMTIVAGALLWMNLVPNHPDSEHANIYNSEYGWPERVIMFMRIEDFLGRGETVTRHFYWLDGLTVDIAVAIFVLATSAFISESLIRRRTSPKQ